MAIQVTLEDHTGNVSHQAKMVENVPVQRLIPAIVTALGLPITDPAGRPITYHLSHNNRRLQEDETLESAGVRSGDTLTVVPEMTAGGGDTLSPDLQLTIKELARDFIEMGMASVSEDDLLLKLGEDLMAQAPEMFEEFRCADEHEPESVQRQRLIDCAKKFLQTQERIFRRELCERGRLKESYRNWLQAGSTVAAVQAIATGVIKQLDPALAVPGIAVTVALWIIRLQVDAWCRGDISLTGRKPRSRKKRTSSPVL